MNSYGGKKVLFLFALGVISINTAFAQYGESADSPINTPHECTVGSGIECPLEIINKTKWDVGTITWNNTVYHEETLPEIQTSVIVHDSDMNTHPTIKDWISIQLWSKSSPDKITIPQLFESSEDSGIFEGQVILINETSKSVFLNQLNVNQTDVVFASYYDWTLPENENSTKIEVIAQSSVIFGSGNADTDEDEIYDNLDKCPTIPETVNKFEDTDGCPDELPVKDSDNDRISDDYDKCPMMPETVNGFEDLDGCPDSLPASDSDGDSIIDTIDSCPTQPETINKFEDTDGCPDKINNDKNDPVLMYVVIGIGIAGAATAIGIKLHGKGSEGKDTKKVESDKHDDDQDPSPNVEVRITGGIE